MPRESASAADVAGNRLLNQLPPSEQERLGGLMERRPIRSHDVFLEPGRPLRLAYFPLSGVVSLMTRLIDGADVETATVGNEGMVGVHAFLGGGVLGNARAIGQVPGETLVMDMDHFRAEVDGDGKLRSVMLAYTQFLFAQISQAVACNAAHGIQQRIAKWMLEAHDRAGGQDDFELTQEFLAEMLGVTRPSVSVAARILQSAGLIRYRRGDIQVLDRQGLEESSCECYAAVQREYERLIGPR